MSIKVISGSDKLTGEKIRYIKYNDINYFIYSLKEQDEEGYEKLYMNKIVEGEEDFISDSEWEELKTIIPNIVKQIKTNNITDFIDLDINQAEEINLNYSRPFKLKVSIVDSIKTEEKIEKMDEELHELINDVSTEEIDNNSIDDLDEFLNNYEEELNKYEEELNKVELPIRPDIDIQDENLSNYDDIEKELNEEKNKNEQLEKKIEELETELNKYKDKLERIKIMLEA